MNSVADSGYVIAVMDFEDQHHKACVAVHREESLIYLPQTALTEIVYFLQRSRGNKRAGSFLMTLANTKFRLIALEPADVHRAGELMDKYADSRLDFVDATAIAIAERLNITRDRQARFWNGAPNSCRCV